MFITFFHLKKMTSHHVSSCCSRINSSQKINKFNLLLVDNLLKATNLSAVHQINLLLLLWINPKTNSVVGLSLPIAVTFHLGAWMLNPFVLVATYNSSSSCTSIRNLSTAVQQWIKSCSSNLNCLDIVYFPSLINLSIMHHFYLKPQ